MLRIERERNVLFNDTLNTFYLRLYGVRHMVKDHSDSEKGNPLSPHRLLLSINSKGYFICTIPDRITHTTAFVTPVVEHWLEQEIAQWVHPMKDRSDDPPHHERTLYLWATSRSLRIDKMKKNLLWTLSIDPEDRPTFFRQQPWYQSENIQCNLWIHRLPWQNLRMFMETIHCLFKK